MSLAEQLRDDLRHDQEERIGFFDGVMPPAPRDPPIVGLIADDASQLLRVDGLRFLPGPQAVPALRVPVKCW